MRFSATSTRSHSKATSAASSMTRSYFDAGRWKQEPAPPTRGHRGFVKKDAHHKFGELYAEKYRSGARSAGGGRESDRLRPNRIADVERRKEAQDDVVMLEFAQTTPKKAHRGDLRVKTEKKSLMSTQKNLVSPLHHESYQGESPQRHSRTIFKDCTQSLREDHQARRTPQLSSIQKAHGRELSHQKSVPATRAANTLNQPSLLGRKPHISSEGFINLHKGAKTNNLVEDHGDLPRLDCFDRSFEGRRAGSRHRPRGSVLSSKLNESIAEEVQGQRPKDQSVVRGGSEIRQKYLEADKQSARNSILNLEVDAEEDDQEQDRTRQVLAFEHLPGAEPK